MHDGALAWNAIGAAKLLVGGQNPVPEGELLNGGIFYDMYRTKDGRILSVGSLEPKFWQGFCQAIGRKDLAEPGTNWDVIQQQTIKKELRQIIQSKTLAEWEAIFAQRDVCVEPILTTEEALNHPQTQARNMIVEVPINQTKKQKQINTPIRVSGHEAKPQFTGIPLGWHTAEILADIGYAKDEIETFFAQEIVAGQQ